MLHALCLSWVYPKHFLAPHSEETVLRMWFHACYLCSLSLQSLSLYNPLSPRKTIHSNCLYAGNPVFVSAGIGARIRQGENYLHQRAEVSTLSFATSPLLHRTSFTSRPHDSVCRSWDYLNVPILQISILGTARLRLSQGHVGSLWQRKGLGHCLLGQR